MSIYYYESGQTKILYAPEHEKEMVVLKPNPSSDNSSNIAKDGRAVWTIHRMKDANSNKYRVRSVYHRDGRLATLGVRPSILRHTIEEWIIRKV